MKYNTVYVGIDVHKYDWRSQNYLSLAAVLIVLCFVLR